MNDHGKVISRCLYDVSNLLDSYIKVHEYRLKMSGTFLSLFRKNKFGDIAMKAYFLQERSRMLSIEISNIKKDYSDLFSLEEKKMFNILEKYFISLNKTIQILFLLGNMEYTLSKGKIRNTREGNQIPTWKDHQDLDLEYKKYIDEYMSFGEELNRLSSIIS